MFLTQQTQGIFFVSILIVIIGSGFYKNMRKLIINLPVTFLSLIMLCQRKELKFKILLSKIYARGFENYIFTIYVQFDHFKK